MRYLFTFSNLTISTQALFGEESQRWSSRDNDNDDRDGEAEETQNRSGPQSEEAHPQRHSKALKWACAVCRPTVRYSLLVC
jgi:hypothetical protein